MKYYVPDIKSVKNISDLRKDLDYFARIFRINVQHALLRRVGQLEDLGELKFTLVTVNSCHHSPRYMK